MDTTDPEIIFDKKGNCNHCNEAIKRISEEIYKPNEKPIALSKLVNKVKREGRNKDYDCIIGLSGGVDSTMVAYKVKSLGLRPLAVHFDNGWNSELAVDNIKKTIEYLDIDLLTHVVEWEEFKDLQLCFLNASVANCETPTDHGITALLFQTASRLGVRFILSGSNLATEAIMPYSWGHYNQDLKHLIALHKRFGSIPLRTMPLIGLLKYVYYVFGKKIRQIPFLNFIEYNKEDAKKLLSKEFGWRDYGGKHYESVWTRFFQGYYLLKKFGYDKRRAHLSTLICSGQLERKDALKEIERPPYDKSLLDQDLEFVMKKFNLNPNKFKEILRAPNRKAEDYPSNYFLFHKMRKFKNIFRRIATSI